ncbi:ATP-binding protein [Streptomyces alkaliterrae]|uniref:histidine kinase n=1 Tax=Streptomyces alkaliterrae TaxID=2213162 RepID=A0A5P0YQM5_9ACTN|nr:sensor histidine kinase [Streptomyces alkaliterrae]MBB1255673.1 sensor histidine kinase [Streptomyces alkaliterrae]MBB1260747.1 sensor histidine kinase [Streptomyces alkaliterrae]MQS02601.1 GHKL domain-containing protein [Streptomyces alkaliterrae]
MRRFTAPRLSLAGQFLALQLVLIVVVLTVIAVVSVAQSNAEFRRTEGRRLLSVAETVASQDAVRVGLADVERQGILQPTAESARSVSGASYVVITGTDRRVLTDADPRRIGGLLELGDSGVLSGRSWVGSTQARGRSALEAHVPVFGERGRLLGVVAAGREYRGLGERIATATPHLLVYLGIASALGAVGSVLLSRRIKRQTLGLEPEEITALVEHREAMLHGIKEGVIGIDRQGSVTLVNDTAVDLLRLPPDAPGRRLDQLGVEPRLHDVLTGRVRGRDQVVVTGDRMLTLNRMPLVTRGATAGSVTTMRDLTELVALRNELETTRSATDTLRAQAHEFHNQLHVIAGLVELEEYPEVARYVRGISGTHARRTAEVMAKVADPSLAALLIAKSSLAAEQGATLRITDASSLGPVGESLSSDLVTVVGNLVDNALDAVRDTGPDSWVEVAMSERKREVRVRVRDSGPGVAPELAEEVFRHGFTTKAAARDSQRGLGLAITRLVCTRRGGDVSADGAAFTAVLPFTASERAEGDES